MTFAQLEHGIRAACQLLGCKEVFVVGSQSLLASYPDVSGPVARSNEMDVLPEPGDSGDDQQSLADILNGNIGEGTAFVAAHGFEVEGVVEADLILPAGWRERTIPVNTPATNGCTGHCLDPYDMAAAKLAAGRAKDRLTIVNLMRQGIIKPAKLRQRLLTLNDNQLFDGSKVDDLTARLERWEAI